MPAIRFKLWNIILSFILAPLLFSSFVLSEEIYKFERMWPTLQQPWYFHQPFGIAISDQGFVYIADQYGDCVRKYTLDGHFVTKWGRTGSGDGEFSYPIGIAIDHFGNVYVSDRNNYRIQRFDLDGKFIAKWGTEGSGEGQFESVFGLAVDALGFVYATDWLGRRVQKFTPDGTFLTQWGSWGSGDGEFSWAPQGIAAGPDGTVYVVDMDRIQRFTPEGVFISKWGTHGWDDGEFNDAIGIAIDNQGYVYITDYQRPQNQIQKFTADGEYITGWGSFDDTVGNLDGGYGIAIDKQGNVYASEYWEDRIQKFTSNGQFLTKWACSDSEAGKFQECFGIAVDNAGNVYVADDENDRVQKFDASGQFITQWGSYGSEPGQFWGIKGIAINSEGFVYVTDSANHRIQKFDSDGLYISEMSTGEYWYPFFLTIDSQDYIYVTDPSTSPHVKKYNPDGTLEQNWDFETGFMPRGIVADSSGYVYVSTYQKIRKLTSNGEFVTEWGGTGAADGQFAMPYGEDGGLGLDVDDEDNIYIADTWNHRFQKFDSEGNFLGKWGGRGSEPGQVSFPADIAIGLQGKIYVSDSFNHRIQVFNVSQTSSNNKAIIVAGGGKYEANNLWNATQTCANFAYRTLVYQGYTKTRIYYLSPDTDLDLDGNGELDDVDGLPTNANLQSAITDWASDAEDLIIYLVDHGGHNTFRTNEAEILNAADLDLWLDTVQLSISGKVVLINEACYSGSFLSSLVPPPEKERILISSTSSDELAKFITQGSISFSNFFWTNIFNGLNVKDAFDLARDALANAAIAQTPHLDDNGNGIGNEAEDGNLAQMTHIGNGTISFGEAPVIGDISPGQTLHDTSAAILYATDVTDEDGIARVWAVIRPPDLSSFFSSNPILELLSIDLLPVDNTPDLYQATYDAFFKDGTYQIAIYARDRLGNTSIPKITTVAVQNALSRKAIIVAGGEQSDTLWASVQRNAMLAYEALSFQGYSDDEIYFMSPVTFTSGVDSLPTVSNLEYALLGWGAQNTQDLVIYMIGNGNEGTFQINNTETLKAIDLDIWLDSLQMIIPGKVTFVYDACRSGSFTPLLAPPSDKERIVITSSRSDEVSHFISDGELSFSIFFWARVLNGANVLDSFVSAKAAIFFSCEQQTPCLDDSGNGISNEKMDGLIARYYTIGTGLVLADDNPAIGAIVPKTNVSPGGSMLVWAEDVTTTGTIDKVWATIRPPGYNAGSILDPITDLPTIDLIDVGNGRYEASYNDFTTYGTYQVAVYAIDTNGNISSPQETSFCYVVCSDDYESDNAYAEANVIPLRTYQYHNFHNNGDEDWIKFYGIPGVTYVIMTAFQGTNCDPVIELYDNDGQTLLAQKNTEGSTHAQESLYWPCAKEGIYYAKIRNYDPSVYGINTEYRLEVWISMVSSNGIIEGAVTDAISGAPIAGATIKSFYQDSTAISLPETGSYLMVHPSGNAFLITQALGYKTVGITIPVTTGENVTKPIFMYPVSAFQDNYEEDDLADQAKVIFLDNISQHHTFHDRGDLDWVKFYGIAGKTYNIWTENSGFNCDIVIELFRDDGASSIAGPINTGGTGSAESVQWLCQEDGIYLIKLQQYDPSDYGDHTEYELKANIEVQNATSAIQGRITYALNQMPISNVIIIARDNLSNNVEQSALSDSNGNFRMLCSLGTYTLHAIAGGIEIAFDNVTVEQNIVTQQNIFFPPVPGDVDGDMSINLLDAIIALRVLSGLEFTDNANSAVDVNDDGKIGIEDLTYIMQNMSGLR